MMTLLQLINHVGNGFDVSRMEISALKTSLWTAKKIRRQKIRDEEEDQSQMQEELAESLGITSRFCTMGMIQKQGNWVPYELKPRDVER